MFQKRKKEIADKYQEKNGIRYRYWKSDEDTRKGKYSKEYFKARRRLTCNNSDPS